MSISASVGVQIPTNVVEVGNEITADQLGAITSASSPSAANPFLTLAGGTLTGAVSVPQINNNLNVDLVIDSYNDTGAGTHYLHKFTPYDGKFNLATNGGGLVFPDSTVQTTAAVAYDTKKAIANLCASCFTAGATFYFTNYVAQCVAQGTKFTSGNSYLLGVGVINTSPTYTFALTSSSTSVADTGITYTSITNNCVCYSEDSGSTWTYADLSF
jgi:hypothetical protein